MPDVFTVFLNKDDDDDDDDENGKQDWGEMLRIRTVCLAYIIFVQITASSAHGHFLLAKF